jgi:hypothetical protein
MTWIIMSPLLLTTFVFAVVPMLMGSNREDRLLHGGRSRRIDHRPRPFTAETTMWTRVS